MSDTLTVIHDESKPSPAAALGVSVRIGSRPSSEVSGNEKSGFSDDEIETVLSLTLDPPPTFDGQVVTVSRDGRTVMIDENWMLPDYPYPFEFQGEHFQAVQDSQTGNVIVYAIEREAP
jgi:hypothetical protein